MVSTFSMSSRNPTDFVGPHLKENDKINANTLIKVYPPDEHPVVGGGKLMDENAPCPANTRRTLFTPKCVIGEGH